MEDLSVVNFTNIDQEDFTGMFGGISETFKVGQTLPLVKFKAQHFANQLADKILMRNQETFGNEDARKPYTDKILGQIVVEVPVATPEPPKEPEFTETPKEPTPTSTPEPTSEPEVKTEEKAETPVFTCDKCGKTFAKKIALMGHLRGVCGKQ